MAEELNEMESSPISEEQVVDESSTTEGEETSSSDVAEVETEQSLLDVVQDALPKEEVVEETASEEIKTEEESEYQSETSAEAVEPQAEMDDWSDVPFNKHPRFRKLIAEKNELKKLSEQFQGDSEQYQKIVDFIGSNNLTADDAAEGFRIMSLIKNSPEDAYKILQGHLNNMNRLTGKKLPKDIQGRLDDGYLDENAAKELSQTRAKLAQEQLLRKQEHENAKKAQHASTKKRANAQLNHLRKVVKDWEEVTRGSDPDFTLKQEEINDRVVALVNERGRPVTSQQVLGIANDAYETVNERYKSRIPSRQPIRTSTGGKLGGTPHAEPGSLKDVISRTLSESVA
jgi:hypothetical protein